MQTLCTSTHTACSDALLFCCCLYFVLAWTKLVGCCSYLLRQSVWKWWVHYALPFKSAALLPKPDLPPSLSLSLSHTRFLLLLAVSFWAKPVNGMQLLAAVIFAEQVAFLMWVPVMKYSWRGCSSVLFIISYVRQSFRHHLPCLAFPYLVFSIPVGGGLLLLNAKGTLQGN